MLALDPGDVVGDLVQVLDGGLRCVAIGADLRVQIENIEVGERIQAGELLVADSNDLGVAIEAQANLIGERGREVVELRQGSEVVGHRQRNIKRGQLGGGVDVAEVIAEVTAAEAVLVA